MKFTLLINVKMPTIVGILTFMNRMNTSSESFKARTIFFQHLNSILPKNHAGPVEKLISDFFRKPKKVGAIDSL